MGRCESRPAPATAHKQHARQEAVVVIETTSARRYKNPSPVGCIRLGARRNLHLFIRGDVHAWFKDTWDHRLFFLQRPIRVLDDDGQIAGFAIARYDGLFVELLEHGAFFSPLRQVRAVYAAGRGHANVYDVVEGRE